MAVSELAIETHGLRKTYRTVRGRTVGVEGLDLAVPQGGVHGFLGPNGSGKTTTIRMLLGLVRPDSGTAAVFGVPVPQRLPEVVARVGAIVESPKFFPAFSARRNLQLLADGIGAPRARVDEVIEQVGLHGRARDRYRTYSLGMKQRLAIAATLLKDPDLLIFDEPTNGLDPAGIHEIRQTMRALGDQGKTVLVSSHILAEVEHVADTVSIVTRGRLVASGRVADLLGDATGATVQVQVAQADVEQATRVLATAGYVVRSDGGRLVVDGAADAAELNRLLGGQGVWASELVVRRPDLESVFLGLTQHDVPGGTSHRGERRLWGGGGAGGRHGDDGVGPVGATDESTDGVRA
ncbi:ABC transporter ATP-binding protein [Isoptericola dokdonensis]|uniref:Daunorubicin/doxorubicin resistance ATP-binding protein DrrA n=1 Tax=Isoptericola dokdonensis DS-3 TaxID=1300344 RepID=A0A168E610_9MICO|nr:ATP-binding cassette domain-containing protein [Isoptericola dokdonensis]ANC29653.1 Daunorubicin/doxorubicin resistance ATP-binding protein DrrA [Isoptericola dokdonensis DS-3]